MYAELLSSIQSDPLDAMNGSGLVAYAIARRAALLHHIPTSEEGVYDALSEEVAYDMALMKLCERHGIEAAASGFSHPKEERARLERALTAAGIDLVLW